MVEIGVDMSRKYLNERWCVRCGRTTPSPYLVTVWPCIKERLHLANEDLFVVDVGCGNGRNYRWLRRKGVVHAFGVDMANKHGVSCVLGRDRLPFTDRTVDVVLCNYVFMFLSRSERKQVYEEIRRLLRPDGVIVVELYPAKDSHADTEAKLEKLAKEIQRAFPTHEATSNREHFVLVRK